MFYYVKGPVAHVAPYLAVIDCGGVGYACHTTNNTLSYLKKGETAKLFTHLNVREDVMELYGFATENELNCFRLLIGVSGVGPKAALSILSATTPEGLAMSIITGDEKSLTVAQGIGKKIAQRCWPRARFPPPAARATAVPASPSSLRTRPARPRRLWPSWATAKLRWLWLSRAWTWRAWSWRRLSAMRSREW